MKLVFGVAVKNRLFGKAFRRVLPHFESLRAQFEAASLLDPIHNAIVIGFSDDLPPDHFSETPNNSGNYQLLIGCPPTSDDRELKRLLFARIARAIHSCQFSQPDKASFEKLLAQWERDNLCENKAEYT